MYIKKILEYSYNYASYIVTDGKNEIKCVCASVPLPNEQIPKVGLEISNVFAVKCDGLRIKKIFDKKGNKDCIKKFTPWSMKYKLRGRVSSLKQSIIDVFGFKISLEYDYPDGLNGMIEQGDVVEFFVDWLECEIKDC